MRLSSAMFFDISSIACLLVSGVGNRQAARASDWANPLIRPYNCLDFRTLGDKHMATNVKIPFTTGNFDLVITASLKDSAVEKFISNGFNWVVQRDGATKAYLILAGEENEKGKLKLPDNFVRKSVPWSDENGSEMVSAFKTALKPYCDSCDISVTEHVEGETQSPMKRATEFVDSLMGNEANETQLRSFLGMFDASASSADREGLIRIANENGVGKQAKK